MRDDSDEGGFTLVEMIVSLLIVTMTLIGSLYIVVGYFRSSHDVFSRSTGVQVAAEQMEVLKAVPWTSLAFYASDSPPTICPAGLPCVGETVVASLSGTRPATAPLPVTTVPRGNVNYQLSTY